MKRPKKNPELVAALSQLRDWAVIERKITADPAARKAWRDVEDWAKGVARDSRLELAPELSSENVPVVAPATLEPDSKSDVMAG